MASSDLLADAFERVRDAVYPAVNGLSRDDLSFRLDAESNSIAWLVWHLTRIQDDAVAELAGTEQVWSARGWFTRFALPLDPSDTGYGHGPGDVAAVTADAELLLAYFEDVHARTLGYVTALSESDLGSVVDRSWDPPVTVSIRLVSVIADDLQHAGQAAFVRGVLQRR
ncbi:MAG: mycothiol transferase [Acidimicrobiales bacterium]